MTPATLNHILYAAIRHVVDEFETTGSINPNYLIYLKSLIAQVEAL